MNTTKFQYFHSRIHSLQERTFLHSRRLFASFMRKKAQKRKSRDMKKLRLRRLSKADVELCLKLWI